MNPSYIWQQKKNKYVAPTYIQMELKKRRKALSKKLNAIQLNPSRWIHEMDSEMFSSVCEMLKSKTNTDIEMARDIVFKSKMTYHQISSLVSNEYLCTILLYGPQELFTTYSTWSYGDVTI